MRVLILSPRQVWPVNSGAKLREYHLARGLAGHADLTLLAFAAAEMRASLPFFSEIITVEPPQRYTPLKLVRGLLGRQPISLLNYYTAPMRQALDQLLERQSFDIVQVEGSSMSAYSPHIRRRHPHTHIVYDWHNIEAELMRRYAQSASPPRKLYASITAGKIDLLERQMLSEDATHLVCSDRERAALLAVVPRARIHTVSNGVDASYFTPAPRTERANRVLFVGIMDYHANIQAAVDFSGRVWPAIHAAFPNLRLTLAGANPVPAVRALAQRPGIEVTGTVPDLRPYYAEAVVSVVPLLTGGGTRLKILEALAAGVPVISTAVGAEGLDLIPGQHFLVAESPEEWRSHISRLLEDPRLAENLVRSGRDLVLRVYDWSLRGKDLLNIYSQLLSPTPAA